MQKVAQLEKHPMTPKAIFGIIVRTTGLISLLYFIMFSLTVGMFSFSAKFFFLSVVWLALSIWLLGGARALVNFAYKNE